MKKGLFPALVALVVLCAIAAAVYIAIQIQPEPEPVVAGMTTEEFIAATSYVYRGEDMKSKGDGRFVELYSGSRGEGSEKHSRKTGMLRELEAKESSDHIGALGVGGAGEPAGGYAKAKGGRIMDESSTIAGDNIAADSHILTAGSYDDTRDLASYIKLFKGFQHPGDEEHLGAFNGNLLIVQAVDSTGMPFPNCQVELNTSALTEPVTVVTRTDGRAIFLGSRDGLSDEATISVRIISPNGFELAETELSSQFENGEMTTKISVNSSSGAQIADSLDLAFVLDCTGSMGDEIRYIQAELKAICGMVDNLYPDVKQRYALVAYRDNGDSFVSRRYDFTASLEEIQNDLNAQEADGGGDFPEAVHVALAEASQLSWSGGNTARVMFHLLDAPPHDNMVGESLNALSAIRSKGIAYYPVVASGSDKLTELLMRTGAILTGGRYIFLTDHSGVGNPHAKPEVPSYDVELLANLMVRMIATELEGVEVPAKKIIEAK